MEEPARMPGKPGTCPFMPASGLAVQDGRDRGGGGRVQGGQRRHCAVALAFMGHGAAPPSLQGQAEPDAVERLDPRLPVDRQRRRMSRWRDAGPTISGLGFPSARLFRCVLAQRFINRPRRGTRRHFVHEPVRDREHLASPNHCNQTLAGYADSRTAIFAGCSLAGRSQAPEKRSGRTPSRP